MSPTELAPPPPHAATLQDGRHMHPKLRVSRGHQQVFGDWHCSVLQGEDLALPTSSRACM